jgi:putative ABC transport system substrate-binding protein
MVFAMGGDPVALGLVASLNRPGDNITGVTFLVNGLAATEVELLHELVPKAAIIGFLVNPKDPNAEPDTRDAQASDRRKDSAPSGVKCFQPGAQAACSTLIVKRSFIG